MRALWKVPSDYLSPQSEVWIHIYTWDNEEKEWQEEEERDVICMNAKMMILHGSIGPFSNGGTPVDMASTYDGVSHP